MDQRRNLTAFQMFPFGFTVTQPPPELDGYMGFQPPTTPPVALGSSTSIVVPAQTLPITNNITLASFDDPNQAGVPTLTRRSDSGSNWETGPDGGPCLELDPWGSLIVSLDLAVPTNFTIGVEVAQSGDLPDAPLLTVEVNGTHVVTRQEVENTDYALVNVPVTADLTVTGKNKLKIHSSSQSGVSSLYIRAVHASSEVVDIEASYYWTTIGQGSIASGDSMSFATAVASGVTTTDTETQTFAETVGVNLGASGSAEGFGTLSAQLNASFTATQSYSTAIALTESTTNTTTITLTPPTGDTAMSYQIWQLCIQFTAGESSIVQALDPNTYKYIREVDQDGSVIM